MTLRQKVLILIGPTASGKSALAVSLAKKLCGEIISADSRQVYRELDIGTGKVSKREMRGIPHHLLDVVSPKTTFSAGNFVRLARAATSDISKRGKLAIVVGGTGFYIDAFVGRVTLPEVGPNARLRNQLQKKTAAQLFSLLKRRDPKRAKLMSSPSERNNKVRLIRALEIAASKRRVPEDLVSQSGRLRLPDEDNVLWIGIKPSQKELERRIRIRLRIRIRQGLIAEGRRLHARGLSYERMEELGLEYRALSRLLQNKVSRKEFEEELYRDIRRYAKKQLAYWKRNKDIRWYDPKQKSKIFRNIATWLKAVN